MAMPARVKARRPGASRDGRHAPADEWIERLVHDLRNPLGIVESYAEMLATASAAEREELCERLRINARRALQVLEEFALLADLRRGCGPPQLEQLEADTMLQEIAREIEILERQPGRIRHRRSTAVAVRASRPHLTCALRVLLRDMLRATAPDGELWVALAADRGTAQFELAASDLHGRTESESGRPLIDPLAIELARRVATRHRGRLTVVRQGRSATVTLTLPASS